MIDDVNNLGVSNRHAVMMTDFSDTASYSWHKREWIIITRAWQIRPVLVINLSYFMHSVDTIILHKTNPWKEMNQINTKQE